MQIYVPIHEYGGHWYLMVVCLENSVIYHLDCNITDDTIGHRRENIKTIVSHYCTVRFMLVNAYKIPRPNLQLYISATLLFE